ncbi:MAG: hypothetical protein V7641_3764 [Blastocatellia bacterium]
MECVKFQVAIEPSRLKTELPTRLSIVYPLNFVDCLAACDEHW